jgi:hypothetical protein
VKIDKDILDEILLKTDENSEYVENIMNKLVDACCSSLDNYLDYVAKLLNDTNYEITNKELDDIIMTIPSLLYYVGTQQERIGIKHDISESTKNMLYNELYIKSDGAAGVKKSIAENGVFDESLIVTIYARVYAIIKSKITYAFELLQSAKKIMSRRIAENDITKLAPNKMNFNTRE